MTESAVVFTGARDAEAGRDLAYQIATRLGGRNAHALIIFASPLNDVQALLAELRRVHGGAALVGCTSAGEFTSGACGEGATCAVAIRSDTITFSAAMATGLRQDPAAAAGQLAAALGGRSGDGLRHRSALVLTDALAGFADELVTELTVRTAGRYQFFGGGAGDDARFARTMVFCGDTVASDAAVALEILSEQPLGIGTRHGWEPASRAMRVTDAAGMRLISLDAAPAVEAFEAHAEATGQRFETREPLPFFLHNVLGVTAPGGFKLRVPLSVDADGAILCAAEVPPGATVHFMRATAASSAAAATTATLDALRQLGGRRPAVALFFDCVATRLRMGRDFGLELGALQQALGTASFAGCNTYGQVVRADGQFNGFHNCTAVVCVIPE